MTRSPTPADVVLVPSTGPGSLDLYADQLQRRLRLPSVPLTSCRGSFNLPFLSREAVRRGGHDVKAVRRLRAVRAPLVHFTSHHQARYGPFIGSRYVVTVHDLVRLLDRDRSSPLIHRPNARDRLLLSLDDSGLRRASALIAVSGYAKREAVEQLRIGPERVHVVYEGVDHDVYRPAARRMLEAPYVLFVGSEHPRKNLGTLFRALREVCDEEGFRDLRLVKIGAPGGPEAPFRERMLEECAVVGIADRLVLLERVPSEELAAWYSGAACLVLPSRHEGFGLPPLEAMACGCPVVISNAGALPEIAGGAAVVYGDPEDVPGLSATLRAVLGSPAYRRRLAEAGRRRAREFSWGRTARETSAVYEAVLRRDRTPAEERAPVAPEPRSGVASA